MDSQSSPLSASLVEDDGYSGDASPPLSSTSLPTFHCQKFPTLIYIIIFSLLRVNWRKFIQTSFANKHPSRTIAEQCNISVNYFYSLISIFFQPQFHQLI